MSDHQRPVLYFGLQSRLHRDSSGRIRTPQSSYRYESWMSHRAAVREVVIVARVSDEVSDEGMLVEGAAVRVAPIPSFRGVLASVLARSRIRRELASIIVDPQSIVGARIPDVLGAEILRRGRRIGATTFAHLVGDIDLVLRAGTAGTVGRLLAPVAAKSTARTIHSVDGVVSVTVDYLQQKYRPRPDALVVALSDVEIPDSGIAAAPRDYTTLPVGSPSVLVTAGSQENNHKGHDVLIDAMAELARRGVSVRAKIIGGGALNDILRSRAAGAGVADSVEFIGPLESPADVRNVIESSDLFVLPSRTEGMPRVLLEAMATGIACIGSEVGGIPELLATESMFVPASASALADVVERTLGDPVALSQNASAGLMAVRRFREDYAGEARMTEFLDALIARSAGR